MKPAAMKPRAAPELGGMWAGRLAATAWESPSAAWRVRLIGLMEEAPPGSNLRGAVSRLLEESVGELAMEHNRLFGSSGLCPIELAYWLTDDPFAQAKRLAEWSGFYRAFGMEPEEGVRPDRLSAALEYLSFLHFKMAYAAQEGREEQAGISERAIQKFLGEFFEPALEGFRRRLIEVGAAAAYLQLAEATAGVLALQPEGVRL